MAEYRIRGRGGRVMTVRVPRPGMSEQVFRNRVERGDVEILPNTPAEEKSKAPARKRSTRTRKPKSEEAPAKAEEPTPETAESTGEDGGGEA